MSENGTVQSLKFVKPSTDPHANILLYGAAGTGKTVGASSAPGPILYLNAEAGNATAMAHRLHGERLEEVRIEGLGTLVSVHEELRSGTHFSTVVLDTVAETYRLVLEDLSDRALRPSLPNYGDAGEHLIRFCRALYELPLNAVLVAHEIAVQDEESGTFEHLPFTTTKSGSAIVAAKLMAAADVVGYTGVVTEDGKDPRYVAQLINGRGRRGKDRFGVLGPSRDLDLTDWIELAKESNAPKGADKEKAAA